MTNAILRRVDNEFLEAFVLSSPEQRAQSLEKLIPLSVERLFFTALHQIAIDDLEAAATTAVAFEKTCRDSQLVTELKIRLGLAKADRSKDAAEGLEQALLPVRAFLSPSLTPIKPKAAMVDTTTDRTLPSTLDAKTVNFDSFAERAMKMGQMSPFLPQAHKWAASKLLSEKADENNVRAIVELLNLSQSASSGKEHLAELVCRILEHCRDREAARNITGVDNAIAKAMQWMTIQQLDQLQAKHKDCLERRDFVAEYLERLCLYADAQLEELPRDEVLTYLKSLREFAVKLCPVYHYIMAEVLYYQLKTQALNNHYEEDDFHRWVTLTDVQARLEKQWLPKNIKLEPTNNRGRINVPMLKSPSPADFSKLCKEYLMHFLSKQKSIKPWDKLFRREYLEELLSTSKILSGEGDVEKYFETFGGDHSKLVELKESVALELWEGNKSMFSVEDEVSLWVTLKNVPSLTVQTFEISAESYLRANNSDVPPNIDLNGLYPHHEQQHTFSFPSYQLSRQLLPLSFLKGKAGLFVVEIVGAGRTCRAVLWKGRVSHYHRCGPSGHVIRLTVDGKDARGKVLMDGQEYSSNGGEDSDIIIPYTTSPCTKQIVITSGCLSSLTEFEHRAESYELVGGILIHPQQMLKLSTAKIVIKSSLLLNGIQMPIDLLEDVQVTATLRGGSTQTSKAFNHVNLSDKHASQLEVALPNSIDLIHVKVSGKVENLSKGQKEHLCLENSLRVNEISETHHITDEHLKKSQDGFHIRVLGRCGEAVPGAEVNIKVAFSMLDDHWQLSQQEPTTLVTDSHGDVHLGHLRGVSYVLSCTTGRKWKLDDYQLGVCEYPNILNIVAGQTVTLPCLSSSPDEISLHSVVRRGNVEYRLSDHKDNVHLGDSCITIPRLHKGQYRLHVSSPSGMKTCLLNVGSGAVSNIHEGVYLHDGDKHVTVPLNPDCAGLAMTPVPTESEDDCYFLNLYNASSNATVHFITFPFIPPQTESSVDILKVLQNAIQQEDCSQLFHHEQVPSVYLQSTVLGDEFRYILNRRKLKPLVSLSLQRPSLLLNPVLVGEAKSIELVAKEGGMYGEGRSRCMARKERKCADSMAAMCSEANAIGSMDRPRGNPCYDFLPQVPPIVLNVTPEENGRVRVPSDIVEACTKRGMACQILAMSGKSSVSQVWAPTAYTPEPAEPRDLRQGESITLTEHYTQTRSVKLLNRGDSYTIEDVKAGSWDVYHSVELLHSLFLDTCNDAKTLKDFEFITQWFQLTQEEKLRKYSEYVCHELNIFLYFKDLEFFSAVVKPYLANKFEKQPIDHLMLGEDVGDCLELGTLNNFTLLELCWASSNNVEQARRVWAWMNGIVQAKSRNEQEVCQTFNAIEQRSQMRQAVGARAMEKKKKGRPQANALFGSESEGSDRSLSDGDDEDRGIASPRVRARGSPRGGLFDSDESDEDADMLFGERSHLSGSRAKAERDAMRTKQVYAKPKETQKFEERHYVRAPPLNHEQINRFYLDLQTHIVQWHTKRGESGAGPVPLVEAFRGFMSENIAEASNRFSDCMLALSIVDLPFQGNIESKTAMDRMDKLSITPVDGLAIVFHKCLVPCAASGDKSIVVTQNIYDPDVKYTLDDEGQQVERYLPTAPKHGGDPDKKTCEVLSGKRYGSKLVVTNSTSGNMAVELLHQLPRGSVALEGAPCTSTESNVVLKPYQTVTRTASFYFPNPGSFDMYPAHANKAFRSRSTAAGESSSTSAPAGAVSWYAPQLSFKVLDASTTEKESSATLASWDDIAARGSDEDVLKYLREGPLPPINLSLLGWRVVKDLKLFKAVTGALRDRMWYSEDIWQFSLQHLDSETLKEYLSRSRRLLSLLEPYCKSTLLPDMRRPSHREFDPLVNARCHPLGDKPNFVNESFREEYMSLLYYLSLKKCATVGGDIDAADSAAVVHYLLCQDRVDMAQQMFEGIEQALSRENRLQSDYFKAFFCLLQEDTLPQALTIANSYTAYPVTKWRKKFAVVKEYVEEANTCSTDVTASQDSSVMEEGEVMAKRRCVEALQVQIEGNSLVVTTSNVSEVRADFLAIDIEMLFSTQKGFLGRSGDSNFAHIVPNHTSTIRIHDKLATTHVPIPEELSASNVVVTVSGGGLRETLTHFASSMRVTVFQANGVLLVTNHDGRPLARSYVKCYSRDRRGNCRFYKDGYTDLRGKFDYVSLSTPSLVEAVHKFSLLVISESNGAVVREVESPLASSRTSTRLSRR